jgi:hypothetical protein
MPRHTGSVKLNLQTFSTLALALVTLHLANLRYLLDGILGEPQSWSGCSSKEENHPARKLTLAFQFVLSILLHNLITLTVQNNLLALTGTLFEAILFQHIKVL